MVKTNTTIPSPPSRPTIIFDGDCGFCRRWVQRWKNLSADRVEYIPYQHAGRRFREIPVESLRKAVHLVEPDGRILRGAHAVFALLEHCGRPWWIALYEDLPLLARGAEMTYGFVASHRNLFNVLDLALLGNNTRPITHHIVRRWFLRLLGVIYAIAFISLWGQILGLVGSQGILPIAPQLRGMSSGEGGTPYLQMPTIFWINASDGMLVGVCAAGTALAIMLTLRIVPVFAAIGAWFCYLSLTIAGQAFLAFQWDALLLEAGFLAIFLSPLQWLPKRDREPRASRIIIWLYRWLLFRLIFLAGLVKWLGHDPNWRNFSALNYHYWTQPLPTWTAWYANLLPDWFQRLSVGVAFFAELVVPLFFFAPRQLRRAAFGFTVAFQFLILITGNFGFFNLLTIVIALLLLDDTCWPFRRRAAIVVSNSDRTPLLPGFWSPAVRIVLAAVLVFVTTVEAVNRIRYNGWIPTWANQTVSMAASFRSTNAYGLFEEMTTRRPEIIVEGSDDGVIWKTFEFKWKPGDVNQRPAFCTPYMPRLDWEMWFAGLSVEQDELPRWFVQFLRRLLDGSPQVAGLLETNAFPTHPPHLIRGTIYYYNFTTRDETATSGAWWRRNRSDFFVGPFILGSDGQLVMDPAAE